MKMKCVLLSVPLLIILNSSFIYSILEFTSCYENCEDLMLRAFCIFFHFCNVRMKRLLSIINYMYNLKNISRHLHLLLLIVETFKTITS